MAELTLLGEPIGERPHVEVVLKPLASNNLLNSAGYRAHIGRRSNLGCLRTLLQTHLSISDTALSPLMMEGKTLDDGMTLEDNGLTLPGPAARRAGAKLELCFQLSDLVLKEEREEREQALRWQRQQEAKRVHEEEMEEAAQKKKREMDEFMHGGGAERDLEQWVEKNIGMSRALAMAMEDTPDFELPPPHLRNFLERCSEQQERALESLLRGTGLAAAKVVMALRNDHGELRERFERSKHVLRPSEAKIKKATSATSKVLERNENIEMALGECEKAVNEFLLFHGTPKIGAVGSICRSGYEICYVGTTTDAGFYGAGFYFADKADLSAGYGRNTINVNAKYPELQVLIINRVVVGNVQIVNHVVNDEERERMTADCLGPGGVFGPRAKFHTVLGGGGTEYVCMSSHQVYPEFVVLYN